MKFGVSFHAGSKAEALARIKGSVPVPSAIAALAIAAVGALDGNPSTLKVTISGEHLGDAIGSLAITVSTARPGSEAGAQS
ncbi:MAG: hypothetical protein ACREHF_02095 [Rhizomicrobium sp.]